MDHKIEFSQMEWIQASVGCRYKVVIKGNQKIRLVEFSEGLVEPDWCRNGHSGYILDGEQYINRMTRSIS